MGWLVNWAGHGCVSFLLLRLYENRLCEKFQHLIPLHYIANPIYHFTGIF